MTDMTVTVNVAVSGNYDFSDPENPPTINASYSGSSTPPPNGNQKVVQTNGNVNLTALNKSSGTYSNRTDIEFTLSGEVLDQNGDSHSPLYPAVLNDAVTVVPVGTAPRRGAGVPAGWQTSSSASTAVTVIDPDTDGQNYSYCLYVVLDGVTCPVDPSIMNRTSN
ncbi:hypothetical protein [Altererythrobacter sp. MF3-039]|uniref:hypothetical protein n=1 Tax=Altererythrobacter sp. MF3-039 TaxID=3252901 RepID=UPI00390CA523